MRASHMTETKPACISCQVKFSNCFTDSDVLGWVSMTTLKHPPEPPKPFGFRPTFEDEAMLIAIRNTLPGRPTMADVVRHALKITCDTCKLSVEVIEQA
jgi:hypothetical protein